MNALQWKDDILHKRLHPYKTLQCFVLLDCWLRNIAQSIWTLYVDLDEFIAVNPAKFKNILDYVEKRAEKENAVLSFKSHMIHTTTCWANDMCGHPTRWNFRFLETMKFQLRKRDLRWKYLARNDGLSTISVHKPKTKAGMSFVFVLPCMRKTRS